MTFTYPATKDGVLYLTEGGFETELMYLHGFELPCFAAFTLLDDPKGAAAMRALYARVCDVAAAEGFGILFGWLNYRASPDWGAKLGLSPEGLREATLRSIDFLDDLRKEYAAEIPQFLVNDAIGPRGDAYGTGGGITDAEAEDYHSVQLETLKGTAVDVVWAAAQNNVPEVIGIARAAQAIGHPIAVSWSLNSQSRLNSGPTLEEAVTRVDAAVPGAVAWHAINCSHPSEFEPALTPGGWTGRLRCIRPNAAAMDKIALCKLGHLEDGDPVELGRQMGDVARRYPHLDIWGGCCGTDHRHLSEIVRNIKAVRANVLEPPDAPVSHRARAGRASSRGSERCAVLNWAHARAYSPSHGVVRSRATTPNLIPTQRRDQPSLGCGQQLREYSEVVAAGSREPECRVHIDADHMPARCEPQLALAGEQHVPGFVLLLAELAIGTETPVGSGLASGAGQVALSAGPTVFGPSARLEVPAAEGSDPFFAAFSSTWRELLEEPFADRVEIHDRGDVLGRRRRRAALQLDTGPGRDVPDRELTDQCA